MNPTDISGNYTPLIIAPISEPVPDVLSLDDILNDHSLILAKESADKTILDGIWNQSVIALKPKLVEWVSLGKPAAFPILQLDTVSPPAKCSDGVTRDLTEYVQFCSGKTIHELVDMLQAKLVGITISFANISGRITIVAMA